ncbi:MAG: hypothetical protein CMI08_06625 [Oceanospirillaceae bacterium]|uniref:methylated-DNA--[protein]-cysteine S-methyltransferase n=1 Tax=unclassified Thalassolituus TaxID=2624967 RepID=UPI000C53BF24|nr:MULTISPECIES: methylated-DNA--[protein]-cysteine S-methyltransferase [unclassified Thalassolituus]MAS24035.1 hypothetical protein [Oceanospirillaceae bacterium]MAX98867.1 hypothetical protein [Oceanospirillaceae bacterium]MBL33562.1 hypothetical protein [Oceanospirillaceae bacterium]MBS53143.1 hypothetical protein [Oceanospirillaceae bacterium]
MAIRQYQAAILPQTYGTLLACWVQAGAETQLLKVCFVESRAQAMEEIRAFWPQHFLSVTLAETEVQAQIQTQARAAIAQAPARPAIALAPARKVTGTPVAVTLQQALASPSDCRQSLQSAGIQCVPAGTDFQQCVWQQLAAIPAGETRSYKQVAEALGRPAASRAVAAACGANPLAVVVPCHRVIATNGALAGYRWGLERKQSLLALECMNSSDAGADLRFEEPAGPYRDLFNSDGSV